jgi:RNA polymerase sigma factor (sigma-70 family)
MLYASFRWPAAEVLTNLVRSAQAGRAGALDALLQTLRPGLLAFYQQRLSADTAEDLTQLALIRISGAIARIDPERADSYISTVARNVLRSNYRLALRDRARDTDEEILQETADTKTTDARIEYADLVRAIHRTCLTKVQPGLREVALGLLDGESTTQIAAKLQISPITVRTRLMRVRAILRRELRAYVESDLTHSHQA